MLRPQLKEALTASMKAKDPLSVSTLRLILAALKDRDVAARAKGNMDGIDDNEILGVLQSMIKQRGESIALYEKGGRKDLADQERGEIEIIKRFLPQQIGPEETAAAVQSVIAELGAASLKDMGRTMAALKERFAGRMDFAKASEIVKRELA